jgi:myosin heavy subunit
MEINFELKGDNVGGNIKKYLIEKYSVVMKKNGERNFN